VQGGEDSSAGARVGDGLVGGGLFRLGKDSF
jgi:hypothetical protein